MIMCFTLFNSREGKRREMNLKSWSLDPAEALVIPAALLKAAGAPD